MNLLPRPKAESYRVAGKLVECRHCENILFHKRKASLSTALTALVQMEWTDREASVLVCANCSRMEWFYEDLEAEKG